MGPETNVRTSVKPDEHDGSISGCAEVPDRLRLITPHGWYSHWHSERMQGQWDCVANDCALVLKNAERLGLTSSDKLITQYTHIVATMHFALRLEPEAAADVFRLAAPGLEEELIQLHTDFAKSDIRNDSLFTQLFDRLQKRFEAYLSEPNESYVTREACAKDPEWLAAHRISPKGLDCYLDSFRPSGADAGAVFLRDGDGAIFKIAEYLPPWSKGADGDAIALDMMSSTKAVTGLLCHIAASRQLLDLDRPIVAILGDHHGVFPEGWSKITTRHLLNQASGLARNIRYDTGSAVDSFSLHLSVPFDHAPGTCLQYSNAGTQLLGFVLDCSLRSAGYENESPVLDFARKFLFNPLDMKNTSFSTLWDQPRIPLTDRGLKSTACEFARLAEVLLSPGTIKASDGSPVLTQEHVSRLLQPASKALTLSGGREMDQDFTRRDEYANCFYIRPDGIATRGTYNTNMDLIFAGGLPRDNDGLVLSDALTSRPCLIFVRQQSDAGIGGASGSQALDDLMRGVWAGDL